MFADIRKNAPVKKASRALILLAFHACTTKPVVPVTRIGELEDMIKKGDLSTKAKLSDFSNSPHLYAIGSITNLDGFIQIIDGKPYNASLVNGSLQIDSSFNDEATGMLYTNVDEWKEFDLPAGITTWKQLEQFIGEQLMKHKISVSAASPFLLRGIAAGVKWHVMDWDLNDKEVTYKKMLERGLHGDLQNEDITAVGFYSKESYRVLTNKELNMQIHFVNHNHTVAGYMDDITLDGRLKLYLPKKLEE